MKTRKTIYNTSLAVALVITILSYIVVRIIEPNFFHYLTAGEGGWLIIFPLLAAEYKIYACVKCLVWEESKTPQKAKTIHTDLILSSILLSCVLIQIAARIISYLPYNRLVYFCLPLAMYSCAILSGCLMILIGVRHIFNALREHPEFAEIKTSNPLYGLFCFVLIILGIGYVVVESRDDTVSPKEKTANILRGILYCVTNIGVLVILILTYRLYLGMFAAMLLMALL